MHFPRKQDIYANAIADCDATLPRTHSPWEEAESTNELSRVRLQENIPARGKSKGGLTGKIYLV